MWLKILFSALWQTRLMADANTSITRQLLQQPTTISTTNITEDISSSTALIETPKKLKRPVRVVHAAGAQMANQLTPPTASDGHLNTAIPKDTVDGVITNANHLTNPTNADATGKKKKSKKTPPDNANDADATTKETANDNANDADATTKETANDNATAADATTKETANDNATAADATTKEDATDNHDGIFYRKAATLTDHPLGSLGDSSRVIPVDTQPFDGTVASELSVIGEADPQKKVIDPLTAELIRLASLNVDKRNKLRGRKLQEWDAAFDQPRMIPAQLRPRRTVRGAVTTTTTTTTDSDSIVIEDEPIIPVKNKKSKTKKQNAHKKNDDPITGRPRRSPDMGRKKFITDEQVDNIAQLLDMTQKLINGLYKIYLIFN